MFNRNSSQNRTNRSTPSQNQRGMSRNRNYTRGHNQEDVEKYEDRHGRHFDENRMGDHSLDSSHDEASHSDTNFSFHDESYGQSHNGPGANTNATQRDFPRNIVSGRYHYGDEFRMDQAQANANRSWDDNQSAQRTPSFRGKGPKNYQRSDERIREEACDALTHDHDLDASAIEVSVESGTIILSGTVEKRAQKKLAEQIVEHLNGVHDVRNEINVQSVSDRKNSAGERATSPTSDNSRTLKTGTSKDSANKSKSSNGSTQDRLS